MNEFKPVAKRIQSAIENFVEIAQEKGLTRDESLAALEEYKKHKLVKLDPIMGRYVIKSHLVLDAVVLRRAAGIDA